MKMGNRVRRWSRRKGSALFVVAMAVAVLAIIGGSVLLLTQRAGIEGRREKLEFSLHSLLFSIHQSHLIEFRERARWERDKFIGSLKEGVRLKFPLDRVKKLLEPFGSRLGIDSSLEVVSINSLATDSSTGFHPLEREINLRSHLRARMGPVLMELTLGEKFLFIQPTDPLWSRFTLFCTKSSELNNLDHDYKFMKFGQAPLVLINHPRDRARPTPHAPNISLPNKGAVYLGEEKTTLNLTGMHPKWPHSELFFFRPASFGITSILPPRSPLPGKLRFFRSFYGFSQDMSLLPGLFAGEALPEGPTSQKWSSSLHLYGTSAMPSPTRVFGPVQSRYCEIGLIQHDVNRDGKIQGLADREGNPSHAEKVLLPSLNPARFPADLFGCPEEWKPLFMGREFPTVFTGYASGYFPYREFCTRITERPFNNMVDFLRYDKILPPLFLHGEAKSRGITLRDLDQRPIFTGDLATYDPTSALTRRVSAKLPTAEEFFLRFALLRGGVPTLDLGGEVVSIESGPLILSGRWGVAEGGMILLKRGDIELEGLIRDPEARPITLVALDGDILLRGGPYRDPTERQAFLFAPRGRVRSAENPSAPMARGGVMMARFDGREYSRGGMIEFDPFFLEEGDRRFTLSPNHGGHYIVARSAIAGGSK